VPPAVALLNCSYHFRGCWDFLWGFSIYRRKDQRSIGARSAAKTPKYSRTVYYTRSLFTVQGRMTDHFTVLINFGPRNPAFDSDYTKYPTYFALHVEKGKTWFSFKMDHKVGAYSTLLPADLFWCLCFTSWRMQEYYYRNEILVLHCRRNQSWFSVKITGEHLLLCQHEKGENWAVEIFKNFKNKCLHCS
jgi:hypothetical protein